MEPVADLVTTVIPSRGRPGLVGRAVQSVLNQTLKSVEVVVVIDGPDEKTAQALSAFDDRRVRLFSLPESIGAQEARNFGVSQARGAWIAFLDDDDEWLPTKLERQLEAGRRSKWPHPLISCGLIAREPQGDTEWPRRAPRETESVADYLFFRRQSETGEIRLQTSTLMTTRSLLTRVHWRTGMHDEWDLLLRASKIDGVGLAFVAEPLVIWNSDAGLDRLSRKGTTWRRNYEWFRSMRLLVGSRPYASFLLTTISTWARAEKDVTAFFGLPWEAVHHGSPTFSAILGHAARWLLPRRLRNWLRRIGG